MISQKNSVFKMFFECIHPCVYKIGGIILISMSIIIRFIVNNPTYDNILEIMYILIPLASAAIAIPMFLIGTILRILIEYIRMLNRLKVFPLTQEEFNNLTESMSMTEALNWLGQQFTMCGDISCIIERKKKYSGYILKYYIFTYKKYGNNVFLSTDTPKILCRCLYPVNCKDIGIDYPMNHLQESDSKAMKYRLLNMYSIYHTKLAGAELEKWKQQNKEIYGE